MQATVQPLGTSFAPASKSPSVMLRRRHVKQVRRTLVTNTDAIRRRRRGDRVPSRMTPRPFLIACSLARRKESNEASTNATVIDIRPAEEKRQRNGKDREGNPCMLNVLKEE
ncbi:hypothetical protein ALC53_11801 [Atta colombica]|uniref:Uncharacterized protein n=1 Tax=Atta colombica TaxID=520822 RepID=A0A195B0H3_9HYME|nr:hypothetical protein ALC53_11801 [Atta colombica]